MREPRRSRRKRNRRRRLTGKQGHRERERKRKQILRAARAHRTGSPAACIASKRVWISSRSSSMLHWAAPPIPLFTKGGFDGVGASVAGFACFVPFGGWPCPLATCGDSGPALANSRN